MSRIIQTAISVSSTHSTRNIHYVYIRFNALQSGSIINYGKSVNVYGEWETGIRLHLFGDDSGDLAITGNFKNLSNATRQIKIPYNRVNAPNKKISRRVYEIKYEDNGLLQLPALPKIARFSSGFKPKQTNVLLLWTPLKDVFKANVLKTKTGVYLIAREPADSEFPEELVYAGESTTNLQERLARFYKALSKGNTAPSSLYLQKYPGLDEANKLYFRCEYIDCPTAIKLRERELIHQYEVLYGKKLLCNTN
jgi:hypothetical protein